MFLKFVDRERELRFLEQRWERRGFELVVIYGRRRIGKTELIKTFLEGKPHIYLLCDRGGTARNSQRFKRKVAEHLDEAPVETDDLEEIFAHLVKRVGRRRTVVVFDEFSYLVEKDGSIPSVFQAIADELLRGTNVFLILCGSSVSMMEEGVLSHRSALYGRKTGHIRLGTIPFGSFPEFFPSNGMEDNIEFYSALGGVPFYLVRFSDKKSALENIRDEILDKNGQLFEEADFLLKAEMREPDVYKAILSAIATGKTKVVEIANATGINAQDMDKYLKVLIRLGFVMKDVPVTAAKSKKSMYRIDDNFFSLSFLFCEPHKSDLEIGNTKVVEERLRRDFNAYVGRKFEKLVRDELLQRIGIIEAQRIGGWWGHYRDKRTKKRSEVEIDIAALNEERGEILFGECKWKNNVDGAKLLKDLKEKARYVIWPGRRRTRKERYLLLARTFKNRPDEENAHFLDLADLAKLLSVPT